MMQPPPHIPLTSASVYGLFVDDPDTTKPVHYTELAGRILLKVLQERGYRVHTHGPVKQGHILVHTWTDADDALATSDICVPLLVRAVTGSGSAAWNMATRGGTTGDGGLPTKPMRRNSVQVGVDTSYVGLREVVATVRVLALAHRLRSARTPVDALWFAPINRQHGLWVQWPAHFENWTLREYRKALRVHGLPYQDARDHVNKLPNISPLVKRLHQGPLASIVAGPSSNALYAWLGEIGRRYLADPIVLSREPLDTNQEELLCNVLRSPPKQVREWERRSTSVLDGASADAWALRLAGRRVVVVGQQAGKRLGLGDFAPGKWVEPPLSSVLRAAGRVIRVVRPHPAQAPSYRENASGITESAPVDS